MNQNSFRNKVHQIKAHFSLIFFLLIYTALAVAHSTEMALIFPQIAKYVSLILYKW